MKRKLLLLFALVTIGLTNVWAYDFSAVAPSGQTLYYSIVGGNAQVTFQFSPMGPSSYARLSGSLVIPSTVTSNGTTYSVVSIGMHAFHGCWNLTSVTIPNSVVSIGMHAFQDCLNLTSVTIPNSVAIIKEATFENCIRLTNVTIPNSVITIEQYAFYKCSGLTIISIPNSVTTIGDFAFQHCQNLTSATIGDSVTTIGEYAFFGCSSLASVTIGKSVATIGKAAFANCEWLSNLIVETENNHYDCRNNCNAIIETGTNRLIVGCKNTIIPNSVKSIGDHAFSGCRGLTSVIIGNLVTTIGDYAFSDCFSLTSVIIGKSVSNIGHRAFSGCNSIKKIDFKTVDFGGLQFLLCFDMFEGIDKSKVTVCVPTEKEGEYRQYFLDFKEIVTEK